MLRSRLLAILAVLIVLFALGAVAGAQDDMVEIEYWQYNFGARVDAMNMLIEQFEAENPGIKVVHNSDIPYADFRTELAASAPAGVGPDVVTLFYGWIPAFVDAGYLVPLPEDRLQRRIHPGDLLADGGQLQIRRQLLGDSDGGALAGALLE